MFFNFKKNTVVGVSVNPETGLEIAQIDYSTKTVLKYGSRQLAYDNIRKEIADLDLFKEALQELLFELEIPKGSDIVLNLPTVLFKVADYPASLNEEQVSTAIEEELVHHPIFQNTEFSLSAVALPNSTIQFTKVAYTVAQKVMLIEIAMQIKELGYNLVAIDTSVNSTLNALIYNDRVDVSPDISWVMLQVDNTFCRVILMQGRTFVDSFEERISIGEVLGDAENYSTVIAAIGPILKNLPSQLLYVVSKTDIISAKILADKILYNAPIVHEEANCYAAAPFVSVVPEIDENIAKGISIDVIGAAIKKDFDSESNAQFNLYNASLGDIYLLEQPPVLKLGSFSFVLSMQNMIVAALVFALFAIVIFVLAVCPLNASIEQKKDKLGVIEKNIKEIEKFLKDNNTISTSLFDEGDEIRMGLVHNKNVYTYFTIVGTEIPRKLWLTNLILGEHITIEGQADNLESIYGFFRNIKDYNPESGIKLQNLGLATKSKLVSLSDEEAFDTDSIITSMTADFYEFKISDAPEAPKNDSKKGESKQFASVLPDLE